MKNVLCESRFISTIPITKGWSEDKKYRVTANDGKNYLLRISAMERYESRKSLFQCLQGVAALNTPMCLPLEFGTCSDGVYSLQSWIDGEDLEAVLPLLSGAEQYVLGFESGEILKKIHSVPAPKTQEDWGSRFKRKVNRNMQKYDEFSVRFDGDNFILDYIQKNYHLLENRPQCFQHGDYHIGNMMEEFNRIVWSAAASPSFATGQLCGYFAGEPPLEFFKLLAFYTSSNTLSSIPWAGTFGSSALDTMMKQSQDVLCWFDNMQNPIPTWYKKDFDILSNKSKTPSD